MKSNAKSAKTLCKRKRLREPSGYNAFSKEFHTKKHIDLKGKSLSEKSKLMAETWREMSEEDKQKYRQTCACDSDNEEESGDLSTTDKKKLALRVAKRHQGDANMLESLRCEVASMMFVDGQVVTIGTPKGKKFLQTHPAIIASFNAYFLYDDLSNQYQSVPTSSSTPTTTDPTLQDKTELNSETAQVQSSNASSKAKNVTTTTYTSSTSDSVVLLKGKDGSIVAKGTILPGRDTIHGHPCKDTCQVVTITDIVQVGAQPWFEDRFDEGLNKGGFVEWPKDSLCKPTEASPIHTRVRTKKNRK